MPIDYSWELGGLHWSVDPSTTPGPVEPLVTVAESPVCAGEQEALLNARQESRSLEGNTLKIYVDREPGPSCYKYLPTVVEAVSKPQKRLNNQYLEPGFEITSMKYDHEIKIPLYAEANIPEAWLVNLPEEII
jgi:hypothetical protein